MSSDGLQCACKGIRSCILCEKVNGKRGKPYLCDLKQVSKSFVFCHHCQSAWSGWSEEDSHHPNHDGQSQMQLPGIFLQPDFLTPSEEEELVSAIDKIPWVDSQSGRRKQDFGPRVNFKKQKIKTSSFLGFPDYAFPLLDRLKQRLSVLSDFEAVELCNLEYMPDRGSSIDPHVDDWWLWGERLVTVNLLNDTVLTLQPPLDASATPDVLIRVPLARRSALVLYGTARFSWLHSILRADVRGRRLAMTFRELSPEFQSGGKHEKLGKELLNKASVVLPVMEL